MKKLPVLFLLFLAVTAFAGQPRFPNPKNPDEVWQNDRDLQDSLRSLSATMDSLPTTGDNLGNHVATKTITAGFGIGATTGTFSSTLNVSGVSSLAATTISTTLGVTGLTTVSTITVTGYETRPVQPAFLAYNSADRSNVTGDATVVTVTFDTEVYDRTGNFASNVFTAPITGLYYLAWGVGLTDTSAPARCEINLRTSNRTYSSSRNENSARNSESGSILADMDAGDTAFVEVQCNDVTKVVDIVASGFSTNGGFLTYFSGTLVN